MIVDQLARLSDYRQLHPGFGPAAEQLQRIARDIPPDGRYEWDGNRLFVIVARSTGKGRERAELEYHRHYIDIQVVLAGHDIMGWRPIEQCRSNDSHYDPDRDLGFLSERAETWIKIPEGGFAIFYPHDAHAPLAATGSVTKAVAKVAVNW